MAGMIKMKEKGNSSEQVEALAAETVKTLFLL